MIGRVAAWAVIILAFVLWTIVRIAERTAK
jgi:hypothetical protein